MARYTEVQEKHAIKVQKLQDTHEYADVTHDDDYEDDMKLLDLKQRLQMQVKPKYEVDVGDQCRSCSNLDACIDIFEQKDDDGVDLAYKLKLIGGIEVRSFKQIFSNVGE